ncbi:MAG: nuclear transport factor 2 family protein [Pseudomonadota bacterium]
MRKFFAFIVTTLVSVHAFAASPAETLTAFHAALHAGEQARAAELLSPDITIYESGYVERSRAEYVGHHLPEDIVFAKATSRKVLKSTERIDGNLATILEETETTGKFKGKDVHSFGTETVLLEKKGDSWVIIHAHWSSRKPK